MQKIRKNSCINFSYASKNLIFGSSWALEAGNIQNKRFLSNDPAEWLFKLDNTLTSCKISEKQIMWLTLLTFFLNGYYHFRDQAHTGKQQKK